MQVTGGRMKGLKKALDQVTKKLDKVNAEITRLQVTRAQVVDGQVWYFMKLPILDEGFLEF